MQSSVKAISSSEITRPYLVFERPTSHYLQSEEISLVMLPSLGGQFDVQLSSSSKGLQSSGLLVTGNRVTIKETLPCGEFFLKARWKEDGETDWSLWSIPLRFTVHSPDEDLWPKWRAEHRLSLMLETTTTGAVTLIDPEAEPPGKVGLAEPKWFATPVYEGATPLVNEEPAYYQDPLEYYFSCIDRLIALGARFVTWHDLLHGDCNKSPLEILLQFDVDGGPRSMRKLYRGLSSRGVKASLMLHRCGHCWYPYELSTEDIGWIKEAENIGWAIGYHNNALSQVVGETSCEISDDLLKKASLIFRDDVLALREHFDIRTFTHHGGNVYNLKVIPPEDLQIIGVDRATTPHLWKPIRTMFSDGGFVARPTTLRQKVESLTDGLHFFRNHPFKYGNYSAPVDVLPRFKDELHKVGAECDEHTIEEQARELNKEARWLQQRQYTRSDMRLAYLRLDKPISSRFRAYNELERSITGLRARRRESFLRLYPWAEGDPRVFWWRMLDAWAPKSGELLNVGALPPDQKDENSAFLGPAASITDMDIDATRQPDYAMDICAAPETLNNRFAGVMLFGLPYFASPSNAISACMRVTAPEGMGLFGFAADTHPARGSIFHPNTRHTWQKKREPLTNIGLKENLWAFRQEELLDLFKDWTDINIEFMGHYWFVVARKC